MNYNQPDKLEDELIFYLGSDDDIQEVCRLTNATYAGSPYVLHQKKWIIKEFSLGFDGSKYLRVEVKGVEVVNGR